MRFPRLAGRRHSPGHSWVQRPALQVGSWKRILHPSPLASLPLPIPTSLLQGLPSPSSNTGLGCLACYASLPCVALPKLRLYVNNKCCLSRKNKIKKKVYMIKTWKVAAARPSPPPHRLAPSAPAAAASHLFLKLTGTSCLWARAPLAPSALPWGVHGLTLSPPSLLKVTVSGRPSLTAWAGSAHTHPTQHPTS